MKNYLSLPGAHPGDRNRFVFFEDTDASEATAARVRGSEMLRDLPHERQRVAIWTRCSRWGFEDVPMVGEESAETEMINPKDRVSGLTSRSALGAAALLRA